MRYTLVVGAQTPSREEHVKAAIESGMRKRYSDDPAAAMQEFLKKCVDDAQTITKVTIDSAGRFIVETLKPFTDIIVVTIENLMKSLFHTNARVECHPL